MQHYLRILFPILLGLCCGGNSLAQATFGARVGTGVFTEFYSNPFGQKDFAIAPTAGLGGFARFSLNNKLSIQPQLIYTTFVLDPGGSSTLSLPVMLAYTLTPEIELELGPSMEYDFILFANRKHYLARTPSLNLGINPGLTIRLSNNWSLNMRYTIEMLRTWYKLSWFSGDPEEPLLGDFQRPWSRQGYLTAAIHYTFR
ncbi:hypothetical protein [Cesiribacter andamanensis]|uniref:Outer membrane protein beta-barrel domain-containing protein n=1 Tax=Cesiribacter andamanensis AMV16 TaxID=1279009 RepID=M7N6B8_9BACT|nr:hypothetical protein [Cesiribacter andamanensis]EMR02817.1 hypothetical protein ADICEAN_02025 [Cesiribacter andamanensis AMV16]